MNENSFQNIYKQLKSQIEQFMDKSDIDYCNMSKIVHQLAQDFDTPIKHRYP